MCGRFSLTLSAEELLDYFHLAGPAPLLEPRYNIAPSQAVAAIRSVDGERRLVLLRWGLIPFWADDLQVGYKLINARSETADRLPSFRAAFRGRRCLLPARGFYEWDKAGGSRQPYHITRADGAPLAFAGLWEHWEAKDGSQVVESCTILTTAANAEVSRLHDRMPVLLEPGDFDLWLDPQEHRLDTLKALLQPAPAGRLALQPVSTYVNKPGHEGPDCLQPVNL